MARGPDLGHFAAPGHVRRALGEIEAVISRKPNKRFRRRANGAATSAWIENDLTGAFARPNPARTNTCS
jgi:tRNA U34 5-methylaminomethyl-2-thiouridine-forming methyltransferase MnmC